MVAAKYRPILVKWKSKNWNKCGCFWVYCTLPWSRLSNCRLFYV